MRGSELMNTSPTPIIYTDKKGCVKYYATYQSAWNACIRMNETAVDGQWLFEGDAIGWYLEFHKD
jgi:hypothetical protein